MNQVRCAGCGDQHLCPGTHRNTTGADPDLITQLRQYLDATFDRDPNGVVSTSDAYEAYLRWCAHTGAIAYTQRRFVSGMCTFPIRRQKRSTMRFVGIDWKHTRNRGRHHATPEHAFV